MREFLRFALVAVGIVLLLAVACGIVRADVRKQSSAESVKGKESFSFLPTGDSLGKKAQFTAQGGRERALLRPEPALAAHQSGSVLKDLPPKLWNDPLLWLGVVLILFLIFVQWIGRFKDDANLCAECEKVPEPKVEVEQQKACDEAVLPVLEVARQGKSVVILHDTLTKERRTIVVPQVRSLNVRNDLARLEIVAGKHCEIFVCVHASDRRIVEYENAEDLFSPASENSPACAIRDAASDPLRDSFKN